MMADPLAPGHDPYDALLGTRIPAWVKKSARMRQAVIQIRKRSRVDLAPVLGIAPFTMAKRVACHLSAAARREALDPADVGTVRRLSADLVSRGRHGAYAYEFDVQTRWGYYPAGEPNLIVTVFAGRALLEAALVTGDAWLLAEAQASADFLDTGLRSERAERPAYRYTALTDRLIHNANLLGAGFVAAVRVLTGGDEEKALAAARTSVEALRGLDAWPYGDGASLGWSDSFHTAYDLDGLSWLALATGDPGCLALRDAGLAAWRSEFFGQHGEPYYFAGRKGPFDIHAAATAIDVLARLGSHDPGSLEIAERVSAWTDANLVDRATGATYYRKGRLGVDRRSFPRWGDAHLAAGRAALASARSGRACPVEAALSERAGAR
jgi:hypothetical protein